MTCLHVISSLPNSAAFARALASAKTGDSILFCGDAVYATDIVSSAQLFVLVEDATARGVQSPFTPVDYSDWVALVCQHDKQIDWG